ncbi:MAG TPA: acyl-CoA thioesterase [Gemmatimonadales bacterium]|jgi:acyl-CoA thioester hydrolase|nr:acyl-CoA thioesterase [Gemmatimonadales bacterium]
MEPVRIHVRRFVIGTEAMDGQGHVSNLAYVGWMQDMAIEHSAAAGWPMARYRELGVGWVVRSHFVEYLRPAVAGQRLAVYTWVPEFTQRSTPRRYLFVREDHHQLVVRAETRWVFVDLATGRRRALPADLLAAFVSLPDDAEVRRLAGLDS